MVCNEKINSKNLLCIVDCCSKFPIVEKVNSLSADNLVQMTKLIARKYDKGKYT